MKSARFKNYYWMILLLLFGCVSQPIMLKQGVKADSLEVCVDIAYEMDNEEKLRHLDTVNEFIDNYNAQTSYFKLLPCTQKENSKVTLTIQNTRYIAPSEQALYVLVSTFGIASILNGGFGFAWAGFSATQIGVKLSDDMTDNTKTIYRQFYSSPYFRDLASVKIKHMKQFQIFLFELFDELKQNEQQITQPQVAG